jgi:hypothetical protein
MRVRPVGLCGVGLPARPAGHHRAGDGVQMVSQQARGPFGGDGSRGHREGIARDEGQRIAPGRAPAPRLCVGRPTDQPQSQLCQLGQVADAHRAVPVDTRSIAGVQSPGQRFGGTRIDPRSALQQLVEPDRHRRPDSSGVQIGAVGGGVAAEEPQVLVAGTGLVQLDVLVGAHTGGPAVDLAVLSRGDRARMGFLHGVETEGRYPVPAGDRQDRADSGRFIEQHDADPSSWK